jgi:PAS domain S-box-containing protein
MSDPVAAAVVSGLSEAGPVTDRRLLGRVRRMVTGVAVLAAGLGLTVLAGWAFHLPVVMRVVPHASSMKPVTAACLILLGLSLCTTGRRPVLRRAGTAGCLLVVTAGVLTLVEYVGRLGLGLDRLLFPGAVRLDLVATSYPGRMAPNTAVAMILLATAQLLVPARPRMAAYAAQLFCLCAAILGALGLYGYVLEVSAFQRFLGLTGMAVHTAAGVLLLSFGTFFARPTEGPARLLVAPGPSAMLTRALLGTTILVPFALGWLCLRAQESWRIFDPRLGTALLVTTNVVIFAGVALGFGSRARRIESERDHSEILLGRHAQMQAALDNMPAAVFLKDLDDRYALVNKTFEEQFGRGHPSLIGLTDQDLFDGATVQRMREYSEQALARDATVRFEQIVRQGHEPRTYLAALFALRQGGTGSPYAICGVCTDITARKQAELELAATAAALRSELVNRAGIEAELRARQDDLKAFSYVVAHDLKGPLAAVGGFAEIIGTDLADGVTDPGELLPNLDRVRSGVDRMQHLIDDLLAYATAGDAEIRPEAVDLQAMVAEIVAERTDHLRGGAIRPEIIWGPLPAVHADRVLCRQLLDNLIGNALKYSIPGRPASVEVSAHRDPDGWVRIDVADRGIGIAAEQQKLVFQTFHRATTDPGYAGTGLGLAICRRVVERHHGTIGVTDNPGGGSRFQFTLPPAAAVSLTAA